MAEEVFTELKHGARRCCGDAVRGPSAHIKTQWRILAAEEKRLASPIEEKPSPSGIWREVREYKLAHRVMLFCRVSPTVLTSRGYAVSHLISPPIGACEGLFSNAGSGD